MSFLHRRRSSARSRHAHDTSIAPVPFPPAVENLRDTQTGHESANPKSSSPSRVFRRVSTLLAGRRKKQHTVTPLEAHPIVSQWRVVSDEASPTDSEFSIEEIRRPSGLGRAISMSSKRSLPSSPLTMIGEESLFQQLQLNHDKLERSKSASSPNLSRLAGAKKRSKSLTRSLSAKKSSKDRSARVPELPVDIWVAILSFLPRHAVATLAPLSRELRTAARMALYEVLDLRTLQPEQVEVLVTLLAYRHDLTDLIQTFECHTWPIFFPPPLNLTTRDQTHSTSFSPSLTATFTIAFQNMNRITSLILPSFDYTFLRHHSAFGLRKLTFLSHTMAPAELTQLFIWLNGQTNITHLCFPNLVDSNDMPPNSSIEIPQNDQRSNNTNKGTLNTPYTPSPNLTPSGTPTSPFNLLRPTTPKSPFNSPSLLPALTTLAAPPSVINTLIAPNTNVPIRPLKNVAISIDSTLYSGLRPAALLNPLLGITTLALKFGPSVDKRTIGKVLSAATALSLPPITQCKDAHNNFGVLRVLEIELTVYTAGLDTAVYKMIASSLPRFHDLVELCVRFVPETYSEINTPSSPPALSDYEDTQVNTWVKHCPTLESVELLSGARWRRTATYLCNRKWLTSEEQ